MEAQLNPGASGLGDPLPYDWGISSWESARGAWRAATRSMVTEPTEATMAMMSRCANFAFSRYIQQAYAAAIQARDCAMAATVVAGTGLPAGPMRAALLMTLAGQQADAERAMREVLRFGREHGHLAFAFPVSR